MENGGRSKGLNEENAVVLVASQHWGVYGCGCKHVATVFSRSISLENLSKDGEVQFANSTVSLANFTDFAVVGKLEAEGELLLSRSKSSNMSTAENTAPVNSPLSAASLAHPIAGVNTPYRAI